MIAIFFIGFAIGVWVAAQASWKIYNKKMAQIQQLSGDISAALNSVNVNDTVRLRRVEAIVEKLQVIINRRLESAGDRKN